MQRNKPLLSPASSLALTTLATLFSLPCAAYVGPGAGLSAIGSLIALLAAIVVALFGFVWFPLKRLLSSDDLEEELEEDELTADTAMRQPLESSNDKQPGPK